MRSAIIENIDRRTFLKSLGVGAAVALVPMACSDKEGGVEGEVFTRANPGKGAGKENSHEPPATLTKLDEAGNFKIDVVVNHGISESHWISDIAIADQNDKVLGERKFPGAASKAEASFEANAASVTKFKVYGVCNLHGKWLNEYAVPV